MKIFLSHYSGEVSDAEDIADHLKRVFGTQEVEIFLASSWESLAPGDAWEEKLIGALESADAVIVLMSIDALGRAWLNFEIGVAWALKKRILFVCHKGLDSAGLPRPYSGLQAVNISKLKHNDKLDEVAKAVASALNLRPPSPGSEVADMEGVEPNVKASFATTYRTWTLRPVSHIDKTVVGEFLVGAVYPSRDDRAKAAGLQPGETLYVRLFTGSSPEGRYIPTLVTGEVASFFESVIRDTTRIKATLRLAAAFDEGENKVPVMVIDKYEVLPEDK